MVSPQAWAKAGLSAERALRCDLLAFFTTSCHESFRASSPQADFDALLAVACDKP